MSGPLYDAAIFFLGNSDGRFMTDDNQFYSELFKGLRELAESAFPKKCTNCGRLFVSAEQFLLETQDVNASTTGLKQSEDDDGSKIIEVFRNCPCGSTLMEFFNDRRGTSEAGTKRREKFEKLLDFLLDNNFDKMMARMELIKVLRGEKSEVLSKLRPPITKIK